MIRFSYKTILMFFCVFYLLSCQNKKEDNTFVYKRSKLPEIHSNLTDEPTACDCLKEMDQLLDALLIIQADFEHLKTQYEKETNQAVKNQLGDYLIDLDESSKPYKEQLAGIEDKCDFSDSAFESCGFFEKFKEKFSKLKP